ncbi:succinate dehydrogenase assembly factor 2, mitochondrial-like [Centruroides vittatus]|uniref:succinate dehydrogenase assembly factor 2, mitochondrial-like n=1 Tax=Centruroides vittatus TaxID=120091 RepID=UPI003510BC41
MNLINKLIGTKRLWVRQQSIFILNRKLSDEMEIPRIPPYQIKKNEDQTVKRSRLLYQSRKRGMLENDLILSTFADKYLHTFNERQLNLYDELINLPSNDWDLYHWLTGKKETPLEYQHEVFELLKKHVKNEEKEKRYCQPDINKNKL